MKIYKHKSFEYWYDRSYKIWYAAEFDSEGNQICDAIFAATKELIIKDIDMELKCK
jgi:hypothetical protein